MVAMATQADIVAELGRALTSAEVTKADAALESASDYVRAATNRKWEAGTYTVTRKARNGRVILDSPTGVTGVVLVDSLGAAETVTDTTLRGNVLYGLTSGYRYEITYTTTGEVPEDLARVVAAMAARDITEDRPQGATSYTVTKGPFTESASFEEPQDSIEPTRAEERIIRRHAARNFGTVSLL